MCKPDSRLSICCEARTLILGKKSFPSRLAEKLVAIDLLALPSIRQLREAALVAVEDYLKQNERGNSCCPKGDEFHFCESQSFIMPAGLEARDVPEFFAKLASTTNASLLFHLFEARLRLERPANDFSEWLSYCGEEGLARPPPRAYHLLRVILSIPSKEEPEKSDFWDLTTSSWLCKTYNRTVRSRRAFPTTETELKLMAAAAMIGLKSKPKNG